jgi:hypothetical protein
VKLVMLFERKKRKFNEFLEHCALNSNESKLRPTNEYLALLTFKVQTFQNENKDPNMQSILE